MMLIVHHHKEEDEWESYKIVINSYEYINRSSLLSKFKLQKITILFNYKKYIISYLLIKINYNSIIKI